MAARKDKATVTSITFGGKVWTVGALTWEQLAAIFPALKIGDDILSGIFLSRKRMETFIKIHSMNRLLDSRLSSSAPES